AERDAYLLAGADPDLLAARCGAGQLERPGAGAGNGRAGVVDEDELLFDHLAREEVVVLAREAPGFAAEVGQQRTVVAKEGLRRRGRAPVGAPEVQAHLPLPRSDVVGAEARLLEVLPIGLQLFPLPARPGPGLPEGRVLPRGVGGQTPGAVGPPVVGE